MNEGDRKRLTIVETNQKHLMRKVDYLCVGHKTIDDKVDEIMQNHLPHIQKELLKVQKNLSDKIKDIKTSVALTNLKVAGVLVVGTLIGGIISAVIIKILGL